MLWYLFYWQMFVWISVAVPGPWDCKNNYSSVNVRQRCSFGVLVKNIFFDTPGSCLEWSAIYSVNPLHHHYIWVLFHSPLRKIRKRAKSYWTLFVLISVLMSKYNLTMNCFFWANQFCSTLLLVWSINGFNL